MYRRILLDCHDYMAGCHPHHGGMTILPTHGHGFGNSGGGFGSSGSGGTAFAVLMAIVALAILVKAAKSRH